MIHTIEDAVEFYQLSSEATHTLSQINKAGHVFPVAGSAFQELLHFGFVKWNADESMELTLKGKRVVSLLAPSDINTNLQNTKLFAESIKEKMSDNKV